MINQLFVFLLALSTVNLEKGLIIENFSRVLRVKHEKGLREKAAPLAEVIEPPTPTGSEVEVNFDAQGDFSQDLPIELQSKVQVSYRHGGMCCIKCCFEHAAFTICISRPSTKEIVPYFYVDEVAVTIDVFKLELEKITGNDSLDAQRMIDYANNWRKYIAPR